MTKDERDDQFVAMVERERPILQGTAFLLLDDPTSAAQLLDAAFAQLYARQLAPAELRLEALRSLVRDNAPSAVLPWAAGRTFELVDGPPRVGTSGIVADLSRLPTDQRAVIVLKQFCELSNAEIADVLERPVEAVLELAGQARAALAAGPTKRGAETDLADELRSAIPYDWRVARGAVTDLVHGRRLIRRARLRRAALAAAAMVALVVLASQLWTQQPETAPATLAPTLGPTPVSRASCDTSGRACQAAILEDWRAEMTRVTNAYLDADGRGSFGYDRSTDDIQTATFWAGHGGALTLDLSRTDRGGTQLSLQIASSSEFASVCGATTQTTCVTTRYMDGNQFTASDTDPQRGIEVQYSQYGDEVITVITRPTRPAQRRGSPEQPISRGDLINLIQDHRLRLPSR
jgi:hypothetical protein